MKTGIVVSSISLGLGLLGFIGLVALGANSDSTTTAPAATASSSTTEVATPAQTPSSAPAETPAAAPEPAAASTTIEAPAPAPSTSAPPAAPGIGQAVVASDVSYTVTSFNCGITKVGDEYLNRIAQGEYCEAVVDIKNQGTRSTMFNSSEAKAYIGDVEYSADGEASIYADQGNAFLTDINPGNSVTAKLYFDVPAGSRPDRIEIGGGLFSKGASISVA